MPKQEESRLAEWLGLGSIGVALVIAGAIGLREFGGGSLGLSALQVGLVLGWLALACLGAWVAAQKGRRPAEGLILGLLFGPLGVLVEGLLPLA